MVNVPLFTCLLAWILGGLAVYLDPIHMDRTYLGFRKEYLEVLFVRWTPLVSLLGIAIATRVLIELRRSKGSRTGVHRSVVGIILNSLTLAVFLFWSVVRWLIAGVPSV
jgi:hypothetical protein